MLTEKNLTGGNTIDGAKLGKRMMYMAVGLDYQIRNMPVTLIYRPYKTFIKAAVKLCFIFSFLVFFSAVPLINLALIPGYITTFYITNLFINFYVKYGYKKIMLILIFVILFLFVFIITYYLRNFIWRLYFNV